MNLQRTRERELQSKYRDMVFKLEEAKQGRSEIGYFRGSKGEGFTFFVEIFLLKCIYLVFHSENGQFKCILKSLNLQTLHQLYLAFIYNNFNL